MNTESLLKNESLFEAIERGMARARAEGRVPQNDIAAAWLARRCQINFESAASIVDELVYEVEDMMQRHAEEMESFDHAAWDRQHSRYNITYII